MANKQYIVNHNNVHPNTGGTFWSIWVCDTYAGRPVTGLSVGDLGIMLDQNLTYIASSATAWAGGYSFGNIFVNGLSIGTSVSIANVIAGLATTTRLNYVPDVSGPFLMEDNSSSPAMGAGHIPICSSEGVLRADADLTFAGSTLSATNVEVGGLQVDGASNFDGPVETNDMLTAGGGLDIVGGATVVGLELSLQSGATLKLGAGASIAALDAGTFTPTRSGEVNMASNVTMGVAQYMRVGNVVTVSGNVTADPSVAWTTTYFLMSVPVNSAFTIPTHACGTGASWGVGVAAEIYAWTTNTVGMVWITNADVASRLWSYQYTYRIL